MVSSTGLLAGLVLALILLAYTFRPVGALAAQQDKSRLEFLHERRSQLEENLGDLEFEFRAGKYPQEEFLAQKAQLDGELAALQAELDLLGQSGGRSAVEGGRR